MEIKPPQMGHPFLLPIAIAKGAGRGGETLNFDEQWVLIFRRVGDKVHVIRRNVHFKARPGTPIAQAVDVTYTDSVLLAVRIVAMSPMNQQAVVINLNDVLMQDFAQLGLGYFDANRSTWGKIKTFPRNVELQLQATYGGGGRYGRGSGGTNIDSRGTTVVIHYGLCELPDGGYQPRLADDRVGYFLSAVKDFSSKSKDTSFVRYIHRWRLEPAETIDLKTGKLSVPRKSIKFYVEKTVPHEFRAAVRDGILEWNKAFEKIGFRDAIEVVQQSDRQEDQFDPEDMNYNTIRWVTTDSAWAIGPSRANPLTGEILDADILFDADFIRYWKHEYKLFSRTGIGLEPASPIRAMAQGWGLDPNLLRRPDAPEGWNDKPQRVAEDPTRDRLMAIQQGLCQCCNYRSYEMGFAALALAARGITKGKEKDDVPDLLLQQAVKETIMHEVGHTLGLRHNFKASTMLKNEDLHNTEITHKQGLSGSVMDYNPVNLAPKGVKQGDYFSTTLGPYDYWAIEYAYKPLSGGTEGEYAELAKIANRGALPGHDYGTDEDLFLTADPNINQWDLGSDVMKFAQDRILLAEELLKGLANRVVEDGEGYQRARVALGLLMSQYGNGAYLISRFVGAESAHRDHKGDPQARDPLVPVAAAKQRQALKFLQEHILTDKPFQLPPELLRKLAVQRWMHWGSREPSTDYPLHDRILDIQKEALDNLLDATVLRRIQTNSLKVEKDAQALQIAEVFRGLTDCVWCDLPNGGPKEEKKSSIIRRNLQREHLARLSKMVLGPKQDSGRYYVVFFGGGGDDTVPPDARSLARLHLSEISKRITAALGDRQNNVDETTLAHLEECRERITKVLNASMQVND
jgi:hypothetical protein